MEVPRVSPFVEFGSQENPACPLQSRTGIILHGYLVTEILVLKMSHSDKDITGRLEIQTLGDVDVGFLKERVQNIGVVAGFDLDVSNGNSRIVELRTLKIPFQKLNAWKQKQVLLCLPYISAT